MTKQLQEKSDNLKNFACIVAVLLFKKENGNYHRGLPLFSPERNVADICKCGVI